MHWRLLHTGLDRARQRGGRHGRAGRRAPTCGASARAGSGSARSTTSARRRSRSTPSEALPLLRLRGGGRRDRLRPGDRGRSTSGGRRAARRALQRRARSASRRTREAERSAGAAERLLTAARAHRDASTSASCGTRPRPPRRASTWPGAACREEVAARRSGSATRRARWDKVMVGAQRDGFSPRGAGGRRAGAAQPQRQRALRPLPRADHVPAGRLRAAGCWASARGAMR